MILCTIPPSVVTKVSSVTTFRFSVPDLIGCTRHLNIYSSITTAVPIEEEDEEEDENLLFDDEYDSSEETETESSDEGECEDECCFECKNRRHLALLDSLPPQVVRGKCVSSFPLLRCPSLGVDVDGLSPRAARSSYCSPEVPLRRDFLIVSLLNLQQIQSVVQLRLLKWSSKSCTFLQQYKLPNSFRHLKLITLIFQFIAN